MTYLEKFIEVFGYEPSRDLCNTMDCKTVGCSDCRYNGKSWGDEYMENNAGCLNELNKALDRMNKANLPLDAMNTSYLGFIAEYLAVIADRLSKEGE